jgi:hypothetical protein
VKSRCSQTGQKEDLMGLVPLPEVSRLSGVPAPLLEQGVQSGLFAGLHRRRRGAVYFLPEVIALAAWSARLGADVEAGAVTAQEGVDLLWERAEQVRAGLRRTVTSK